MRLLSTKTYEIHEFPNEDKNRAYAILSHTWGDEECTLQQMTAPNVTERRGYAKIKYCCEQAQKDGLELAWRAWVDTYHRRALEAINSMFRWYSIAAICYSYLVDVASIHEFSSSRWFTRGWTLQELIAPKDVRFYSSDWKFSGSKLELQDQLWKITGINRVVLKTGVFDQISIAARMSWAANRQTTRVEDWAYSLMGIFDVNMPLLYGEGKKAFIRLQEEIMKTSDDQTLFAWGLPAQLKKTWEFSTNRDSTKDAAYGLLAESPADFASSHEILPLEALQSDIPPTVLNNGVRIELPVVTEHGRKFAAISCVIYGHYDFFLGIPLLYWSKRHVARCGDLVLIAAGDWSSSPTEVGIKEILLVKKPIPSLVQPVVNNFKVMSHYLTLTEVHCVPDVTYFPDTLTIKLSAYQQGPHTALFFTFPHKLTRGGTGFAFAIVVG